MAEGTLPPAPESEPNPFLHPDEPDAAASHAPAHAATPPPKRKRRRRWPKVLLVVLVLIILVVVFAPSLLSTAPARAFVVGRINQRLNGRVEVADWSLGWNSPVSISGVKLFDKSGAQVVEMPRLTTELTLFNAARGNLKLGKVTVDGLDVLLRRDAQGNVNLSEIARAAGAESAPSTGGKSEPGTKADTAPTKLPDVSGELHLVNCRATYEDHVQGQTFHFPSITGQFRFPDINQPIETVLDVQTAPTGPPTP